MSNMTINSHMKTLLGAIAFFPILSLTPTAATAANLGFENNNFDNWQTSANTSIVDSSFGVTPTEGNYQALLSTAGEDNSPVFELVFQGPPPPIFGIGDSLQGQNQGQGFLFSQSQITDFGNSLSPQSTYTQGSAIKTNITVNAGDTLKFDYNFLTNEHSSLPISNNDLAFFSINEQLFELAMLSSVESSLLPSSTSFSRETGYQQYTYTFTKSGNVTLGFAILDEEDVHGDSGLLVDNIRIEPGVSVPEPLTILGAITAIGFGTCFKKSIFSHNKN
ncbi:PEP-CTERM sorting domain-containing protein [Crocosphaera watsonii]|uniref:PEP-CTERM sorting domain-containing protein n=4 Tax=Crocosphaera watsonii TaxID=263511 RepID=T2JJX9_CROWT|nr:PEP-CTERM sorting domain-containing protein [Crocosphaera watsonii]EHJ12219.1 hypothetical protein CWATWH0003_3061 [Crocosphaera watsonii WH 0003]CCQ54038.1 hypothetical protein CWATWH0005_118 [Crocosphaera watsonii WH 0005]CCQ60641.1 hypothetical protein CWATWH0401_2244 [Crocosphaera watsonii WH 0401]CCQ65349.1 hypothetical protein CWATWH0402_1219 [Crocosphaera watsonii WH 0402]